MTPEALRALADTVAWQDRTDLHEAMLGAADEIERLRAELDAANALFAAAREAAAETLRQATERSRAVRAGLDPSPRDDGRSVEEGGCW